MIKINLLNSFGVSSSEVLQQLDEQKNQQNSFIKRIFVMFLGVIVLFAYEQYKIPQLNDEKVKIEAQINELSAFNQKKEALKLEIEKYEKDLDRLNKQTVFLQKIQKERALPFALSKKIRANLPKGAWLTSLKIEGSQIDIRGEAETDKDINEFSFKLAAANFLKDVAILTIELRESGPDIGVPIKTFTMKAQFSDVNTIEEIF